MNILLLAAQYAPYVAERPSAESVAQLARALRLLEHNVTVLVPRTEGYQAAGLVAARRLSPLLSAASDEVPDESLAHVYDVTLTNGVRLALLDVLPGPRASWGGGAASTAGSMPTSGSAQAEWLGRWARAVGAYVRAQAAQGTAFDVVHAHDCEVGLALLAVKEGGLPTVLTVHDAAQTGAFPRELAGALGLPPEQLGSHGFGLGDEVSLLKGLLGQVGAVVVASENYGKKLQAPEYHGGLARAFQQVDLLSIGEGIDQALFNPATDSTLSFRYDAARPESKGRNRAPVLDRLELAFDPGRPIVFCEFEEWGDPAWSTLISALPGLLRNETTFILAGGAPPPSDLTESFVDRLRYLPTLDGSARRSLLAASDFYLSVNRKDPTGRRLMQASRYGAVPVAHVTDAVVDVLVDCDSELSTGNSFLYESLTQRALQTALARAVRAFNSRQWPALIARVMRRDSAWDRSARRYTQVYSQLIQGG